MRTWLTVNEAAQYAGVSRDTIYTACQRREIRQVRVGGRRAIRLKPEWIDAWLERHVLEAQDRRMVDRTPLSLDVQAEATS
jgi:excisionase family DNA binding protein